MIEEPASQYLQALEEYCIYKQRGLKALTIAEIQHLETINELKDLGKRQISSVDPVKIPCRQGVSMP